MVKGQEDQRAQLLAHVMKVPSASSLRLVAFDFEAAETAEAESPSPAAALTLSSGGQVPQREELQDQTLARAAAFSSCTY